MQSNVHRLCATFDSIAATIRFYSFLTLAVQLENIHVNAQVFSCYVKPFNILHFLALMSEMRPHIKNDFLAHAQFWLDALPDAISSDWWVTAALESRFTGWSRCYFTNKPTAVPRFLFMRPFEIILLPVFKGKGDPMECGSHRAIKLLEHAMKVIERVFEWRIRVNEISKWWHTILESSWCGPPDSTLSTAVGSL